MADTPALKRYKLVIVGDGACGKTSILTVFKTKQFLEDWVPTIFETTTVEMSLDDGQTTIELSLWDTAGQEDYERLRPMSYPNTDIVLICFSVDRPDTLINVEAKWVKEIKHFCRGVPIILVGNKTDLRTDAGVKKGTQISTDKTKYVANKINALKWIECSAKTQANIPELFQMAAKAAIEKRDGSKTRAGNCCAIL